MKKILAFLLATICVLSLASCSALFVATQKIMDEKTLHGTTSESQPITAVEAVYEVGTISDNRYESDYFEFGFETPDNWTFLSRDELYRQFDLSADAMGYIENGSMTMFPEVYAIDEYNNSIQIIVEKDTEFTKDLSMEERVELCYEPLTNQVQSDYDYAVTELVDVVCANTEYPGIKIDIQHDGTTAQQLVFLVDGEDYVATVTISKYTDIDYFDCLDWFYIP